MSNLSQENLQGQMDIWDHIQPDTVYNFVLLTDRIVFTKAGDNFVTGLLSKHIFQTGFAKDLRFAGQVKFLSGYPRRIIVNNASGSYRPGDELLPSIREFFQSVLKWGPTQTVNFRVVF